MCGIYGRIGPPDEQLDLRATQSLHHRGPDGAGLWLEPLQERGLALGHARLAIVDLTDAGFQPMHSADGRYVLVFNGEIYNFLSLRTQLESQGRQFVSHCDTEVILHLYALHGDAMLPMLEGMFALALWDRREKRLLLARDATGIKPLFYRQPSPETMTFASEIKALLIDPACPRQPDLRAIAGYLGYLFVPAPATAFQGIRQLLPGHALAWQANQTRSFRFHQYRVEPKQPFVSLHDASQQLESLLKSVLAEHMMADVPVGAFLSGGIDSGLLVAMMQRLRQESGVGGQLQTLTVGFSDDVVGLDETQCAAQIAQQLGVKHEILRVDSILASDGLSHVIQQFDVPFANSTAQMLDVLCQKTRQHVTVAVTGDGGDEAFAGYPRYRATWPLIAWQYLPQILRTRLPKLLQGVSEGRDSRATVRRMRRFLTASSGPFAHTYRDWLNQAPLAEQFALLTPETLAAVSIDGQLPLDLGRTLEVLAELPASAAPLDAACYADVHSFLPDNILSQSDRMSMRHGVELRVPFADRRIIDFGLRLPTLYKSTPLAIFSSSGRHAAKRVLRDVAARYLPQAIANLPKKGFVAPMGSWLAGPLKEMVSHALRPEQLQKRGIVRPEVAQQLQAEHQSGKRDNSWRIWSLVVLETWFQQRIDRLDLPDRSAVPVKIQRGQ